VHAKAPHFSVFAEGLHLELLIRIYSTSQGTHQIQGPVIPVPKMINCLSTDPSVWSGQQQGWCLPIHRWPYFQRQKANYWQVHYGRGRDLEGRLKRSECGMKPPGKELCDNLAEALQDLGGLIMKARIWHEPEATPFKVLGAHLPVALILSDGQQITI